MLHADILRLELLAGFSRWCNGQNGPFQRPRQCKLSVSMEIDAGSDAAHDAANMPWPAGSSGGGVMACLQDAAPNTCITCTVDAAQRRMN